MASGKKIAAGVTAVLVLAIGGQLLYLHHERNSYVAPAKADVSYKVQDDDLVHLKHTYPSEMKDAKALAGKPLWISAGGQLDYYPVSGSTVSWTKSAGILLGAQRIDVKDAILAVAPKKATFRIPGGNKQVELVFTLPGGTQRYAVPAGYEEGGRYTFFIDDVFFYEDPHELYKHWGAEKWAAIDRHEAIKGMNERQAMLALGQVESPSSTDYGNRVITFDNVGKPVRVVFEKDKATNISVMKP